MKIAIVYNRESQRVINLLGMPNREKYGLKSIKRISDAFKKAGHQVASFEGDKDLIDRLEEFMPRVMKHERPGMVFNLAYGIQGQARYTHVPGMLEMIGLPYVGSGPLAHSLALDKVVSKMIFVQKGIPTPAFAVLENPADKLPSHLTYPLIVKPKNEAVSFGIRIVNSDEELREAAGVIFQEFQQAVLVEKYIAGREINVGLLGNNPVEVLPPAELIFGEGGPNIYTLEDKKRQSGREVSVACPANLSDDLTARAKEIAKQAFESLGCFDCARVDLRLDSEGNFYVLEVNSLPSLGEHGSYIQGAAAVGLDFAGLVNHLVDVAASRYFGTPHTNTIDNEPHTKADLIADFLMPRRDELEREVANWTNVRSRTSDPFGAEEIKKLIEKKLHGLGLKANETYSDDRVAWTWETPSGFVDGTLVILHVDVPVADSLPFQMFRREPERLFGEGIGCSRAPIASLLFALKSLRSIRALRSKNLGVLFYCDEGRDCRYSQDIIRAATKAAKRVIVLKPGNLGEKYVTGRRGQGTLKVCFQGKPTRLGKPGKRAILTEVFRRLDDCMNLSDAKTRISVGTLNIQTENLPMMLPHRVDATIMFSFPDQDSGSQLEKNMREILLAKGLQVRVDRISIRPPMLDRGSKSELRKTIESIAKRWEIPLKKESSAWPSVGGLAPEKVDVICGVGPVCHDIYRPEESVERISLVQRTLLLAELLLNVGNS